MKQKEFFLGGEQMPASWGGDITGTEQKEKGLVDMDTVW